MKRYVAMFAVMTLLVLPAVTHAAERGTMPEQVTVDAVQLVKLLVKKGFITPEEHAQLVQPGVSASPLHLQSNGDKEILLQLIRLP